MSLQTAEMRCRFEGVKAARVTANPGPRGVLDVLEASRDSDYVKTKKGVSGIRLAGRG